MTVNVRTGRQFSKRRRRDAVNPRYSRFDLRLLWLVLHIELLILRADIGGGFLLLSLCFSGTTLSFLLCSLLSANFVLLLSLLNVVSINEMGKVP